MRVWNLKAKAVKVYSDNGVRFFFNLSCGANILFNEQCILTLINSIEDGENMVITLGIQSDRTVSKDSDMKLINVYDEIRVRICCSPCLSSDSVPSAQSQVSFSG